MKLFVHIEGRCREVDVRELSSGTLRVWLDGQPLDAEAVPVAGGVSLRFGTRVFDVQVGGRADDLGVCCQGLRARAQVRTQRGAGRARRNTLHAQTELRAPMPGRVVRVLTRTGQPVEPGQALVVVEAMKMQNELRAASAGNVAEIAVNEGDEVEADALLVRLRRTLDVLGGSNGPDR
ncbi:MAG: biotin/lipoyl-binding protein [Proteobacteria bacterium]|nr:biotin/lipoyl-binding protein [Pseudomonadota bacterium]